MGRDFCHAYRGIAGASTRQHQAVANKERVPSLSKMTLAVQDRVRCLLDATRLVLALGNATCLLAIGSELAMGQLHQTPKPVQCLHGWSVLDSSASGGACERGCPWTSSAHRACPSWAQGLP